MTEEQLLDKLHEINDDFKSHALKTWSKSGLFTGMPGNLLFRLYYQRWQNHPDEQLENDLIEFITEQLQAPVDWTTFCNGLSGFGWFIHHLNAQEFIELDESLFSDFDEAIFKAAMADLKAGNHDYMHGALGALIYLAGRYKHAGACETEIKALLNALKEQGHHEANGIYWTQPDLMLEEHEHGKEVVNLNLSHGLAGKIVVFAELAKLKIGEAKELLALSTNFLLNQANNAEEAAIIPTRIFEGTKDNYAHLGWCRGNVSIALALLIAAEALENDEIKEKGIEIAEHTLKLDDMDKTNIVDFGLCHGTSGLSHMYQRLYNQTKMDVFKERAEIWMSKTLEQANMEGGIAGFKTWDNLSQQWLKDQSLLTGTAGIGLIMLANLSMEYAHWDKCMLLS